MLEKIPDFNLNHKTPQQITSGVDLAPVVFSPSLLLYRLEVFVYLFMLLSASVAIFPFIFTAFYWPLLWLTFLVMIIAALRKSLQSKKSPSINLCITQKVWHLQTSAGSLAVEPCNEIVVWTKLIILPVKETLSGRKHRIVALPDSMTPEDWRRLRVWLRIELRKSS
ncbi:MAG: hypothetical protein EOO52_11225 [Gammaproteobacteria bacterium]|nr:MAG: hypothetical protein EOO52_11225 [Gammaproteobacteria bacterium]